MWPLFLRAEQVEPVAKFLRGIMAVTTLAGLHVHVPHQTKVPAGTEYEFIVVGAGTAGSIIASRLVETPARVLLLEAGDSPPVQSVIPGLFALIKGSEYDWQYKGQTNSTVCRAHKGPLPLVQGKMLGGSSAANYMHHVLGHPADYDEWATLAGDDSWTYQNMKEFIKKMESVQDDDILNSKYGSLRGRSGNINITRQIHREETVNYFEAFFELGHRISHDYNTGLLPSFSEGQFTIGSGRRSSTAAAYLVPAARHPNLTVVTHAHVNRVLFEGDKAVAVEATVKHGETITVKAKSEIILSAGAINTPTILMRSGIGPQEHLKNVQIPVLSDLPVGYNLQDHYHVPIILTGGNSSKPDPTTLHEFPLPAIIGFVTLNATNPRPNYQLMGYPVARGSKNLVLMCHSYGLRDDICNRFDEAAALQETFLAHIVMLHPESRGRVHLTDSDRPGIYLGYYDVERDLERQVDNIEDFLRVLNTTYFRSVGSRVVDLKLEECAGEEYGSRGYWKCYARNMASTLCHPAGTAAMGTVLDARLRVRRTQRLRVADASAIPTMPSGNTNAPVALLAEHAAQLIKEDHGLTS